MNDLVTACAQDGRAQNLARFAIHNDLHEALRFSLFNGTFDFCHGTLADKRVPAGFADFRFRKARASERRIDV